MTTVRCHRRFSNELFCNIHLSPQNYNTPNQLPTHAIDSFKVRVWIRCRVRNNHPLSRPIIPPQFSTFEFSSHSFFSGQSQALLRTALSHPSIPRECADDIVSRAKRLARDMMVDPHRFLSNPCPRAMLLAINVVIFDTPPVEAYNRNVMEQNTTNSEEVSMVPVLKKTVEELLQKVILKGETDNCSICLVKFNKDEELSATPCQHVYHHGCIVKWLVESPKCPLCRRPIQSD